MEGLSVGGDDKEVDSTPFSESPKRRRNRGAPLMASEDAPTRLNVGDPLQGRPVPRQETSPPPPPSQPPPPPPRDPPPPPPTQKEEARPARPVHVSSSMAPSRSTSSARSTVSVPSVEERTSFTAETPYFSAFCDSEVRSLDVLGETLLDIAARTRTFAQTGALMSEATRRLSMACKLRQNDLAQEEESNNNNNNEQDDQQDRDEVAKIRRAAVGEEMAKLLAVLGGVLEEVAVAQSNLCSTVEQTLAMGLDAFADSELKTVSMLKTEAEEISEASEQLFSKYLNGRHHNFSDANPGEVGKPGGGKGLAASLKNWSKKGLASEIDRQVNRSKRQGRQDSNGEDATLGRALEAANLQASLEQLCFAQANAELRRYQLMKHLISVRQRRNFELSENTMATIYGLREFYTMSKSSFDNVMPAIAEIQERQNELRENHSSAIVPTWREREVELIDRVKEMQEQAVRASRVVVAIAQGDPQLLDQQLLKVDDIEDHVQVWALPKRLADVTRYQREVMRGVLVEGWLYKKSSAVIALQPWARRWFVMDKSAIYYYRTEAEMRKGNGKKSAPLSDRVKVCDIVLCTVRELPSEGPVNRFCFQLVTPTEKPLTLQARGPMEYRMWVEGIKTTMENQLVHGDPHSHSLNKNLGPKGSADKLESGNPSSFSELPPAELRDGSESSEVDDLSSTSPRRKKSPHVQEIMEANGLCADCGTPNPDWASLNLGVVICMECSGVHRSLGVHVSKVRSLMLDSLSEPEYQLLLALGNERANEVWEEGIAQQRGWVKPNRSAERKAREDWIKSKYAWKGFLSFKDTDGRTEHERQEKFSKDLYAAAKAGDLRGAQYALSHGGSVNFKNEDDGGKTPLHVGALRKLGDDSERQASIVTAEFLIQNGAKLDTFDGYSHGVIDCALLNAADIGMVEYLTTKK